MDAGSDPPALSMRGLTRLGLVPGVGAMIVGQPAGRRRSGSRAVGKESSERGVFSLEAFNTNDWSTMKRRVLFIPVAVATLALASTAFGESAHSSAAGAVVSTHHTSLGTILATGSGRTLYLDSAGKCTGGCLAIWPPLKTSGAPKASGGAKAADLGTTKLAGGKQVTYKGHPLYTFASDTKSGETSGEGVSGFYVVSPSGSKITKSSHTTTSSSSSSGYHY
jgi:predicted lipoprotein with Yx(FWY)xxD motif